MPIDHDHHDAHDDPDHDDHGGLGRDLATLMDRRRALAVVGGLSLAGVLAACGSSRGSSSSGTSSSTTAAAGGAGATTATSAASGTSGDATPSETQGPYPADGSNGPNVLADGAVVRQDITTSFGDLSGTAEGVPATLELNLVSAADGTPLAGGAVYVWHCTAGGQYSIYEVEDQNYLRGVQEADADGKVTFQTIFPGCYRGRWPHVHFEVFESLEVADAGSDALLTSQLALPQEACEQVYADSAYGDSIDNLGQLSLASDNIFSDGADQQLATVSGSNAEGTSISLTVAL